MLPIISSDLTLLEYTLRSRYGNKNIDQDNNAIYERAVVKYNLANFSVFHNLDAAIADIEKFIENEPDRDVGYLTRAEMLSMKLINLIDILEHDRNRIIQRIRADYLKAREIVPTNGWAWLGLMEASLFRQDWDEAIGIYGESAIYIKTQEQKLIRSLFGYVALVLAGESIEEEDSRPLHYVRFSEDEKRKLKKAELGSRLARLRHIVLNKLPGKPTWGQKLQMASDMVNTAIIEFNVWPKFSLSGHKYTLYSPYENVLELMWVNEERVIKLKKKAQAVKIEMSSRYSKGSPPAIKTLSSAMDFNDNNLKANINDASTWSERAIILEGLGRNKEALMALEKAGELNTDPNGAGCSAKFMKARLLWETERYQEALKVYDEIIGMAGADVSIQALAWVKKAEIIGMAGADVSIQDLALDKKAETVKSLERWRTSNLNGPKDNRALREEALASVERAIVLQPDFVEAWIHKADILKNLGRYEESLKAYDQSLSVRPYYAILSGKAINALREKAKLLRYYFENYEEALEVYNAILPFGNDDSVYAVMVDKGALLEELGHYEECIKAYEKAAAYDLFTENIYHIKARIFIKLEQYEDALCAFDKAIENSKRREDKAGEWRQKAELLERLSRYDEARQAHDIANNLLIEEGSWLYESAREDGIKAEKNDKFFVLFFLEQAIKYDEKFKEKAKTDTAFDSLRDDPEFQKILE